MVPQQGDGAERLQAKVAHVRLLAGVGFHVTIEARDSGGGEHAGAAAKGPEGSLGGCGETEKGRVGKSLVEQPQGS